MALANRTTKAAANREKGVPHFDKPTAFARRLRESGKQLLSQQRTGRYADRWQWFRAGAFIAGFCASYAALLSLNSSWTSLLLAALCGFFAYVVLASMCHDASHYSLSPRRWINRVILFAGFCLIGASGALWARRHIQLHHMFTNVEGNDIDSEASVLIRLSPHKPWKAWHRLQPLYAPFLYMLVLPYTAWVEDFHYLSRARQEAPQQFKTLSASLEFAATKLIHVVLALVLPFMLLDVSVGALLLGYLIASGVSSFMFAMINVGTHISDKAAFVAQETPGEIGHDWATHQVMTSVDWAPTSPLAIAVTGGANSHTAHHLFPHAAHCHNARLSALVSKHAAQFGRRHNVVSFAEMLASHWRHLVNLSRNQAAAVH